MNDFLFKIKRKESPKCTLCEKKEETLVHLFCESEKVTPIWHDLLTILSQNLDSNITVTNFEKLFGICSDKFVSYLCSLLKYHIYTCKFKNKLPNSAMFKSFVKKQKELEYLLAKKRNKLFILENGVLTFSFDQIVSFTCDISIINQFLYCNL